MSRKTIFSLERSVRALPAAPPQAPPPPTVPTSDLDQLAREAIQAFAAELQRFRHPDDDEHIHDPREQPSERFVESIKQKPPEDISFYDIERLTQHNPEVATAKWAEVKAAAVADLDKGWLAARSLEPCGGRAWDRACFLAIRARLRCTWPPRQDAEAILVDQIAQYEMMRGRWVAILAELSHNPLTRVALNRRERRDSDRQTIGSVAEATQVLDRLNRLIHETIRTLLRLRRAPAVVVQNVAQLNVATGPQMNVHGSVSPST